MNSGDILERELLNLRIAVGRKRNWDQSSLRLLEQHQDPVKAYAAVKLNQRRLQSVTPSVDDDDPMLSLEIRRDRALIGYVVSLGAGLFAIWIIAMIMIMVG